jgi:hypothetical protein
MNGNAIKQENAKANRLETMMCVSWERRRKLSVSVAPPSSARLLFRDGNYDRVKPDGTPELFWEGETPE